MSQMATSRDVEKKNACNSTTKCQMYPATNILPPKHITRVPHKSYDMAVSGDSNMFACIKRVLMKKQARAQPQNG